VRRWSNKLAKPPSNFFQIALIGGETLLGGELKEVFEAQIKEAFVNSYAATGEGTFGEDDGESVYVDPLDDKAIASSDVVVVAGAAAGALKAYALTKKRDNRTALIDCSGHLEQEPESRVIAPVAGEPNPAGFWLFVTAHPAAAAISVALQRLGRLRPVIRSVVNVFEPASERGKAGAAELHQQVTSLLAFKGFDRKTFDAQLAFNLLPKYGVDAPLKLAAIERRIERHVSILMKIAVDGKQAKGKSAVPLPSVRLIQAPVFHAYSISLWVEFGDAIEVSGIEQALASAQIEVREHNQETPHGIGAAGHSGFIAGDIRIDHSNPRAAWIWIVCDNLRTTADSAVSLIRSVKAQKSL
jgi:aspartate-semialdehyde dehydrogenase